MEERFRIGQILLKNSELTQIQLEKAIRSQRIKGGVLGEILLSHNSISPFDLFNALSMQVDMRFLRSGISPALLESDSEEKNHPLALFKEKVEKLSLLLKTYMVIFSEKNFAVLLEILAQEAPILLDAERSSLFLFDEQRHELWSRVAIGLNNNQEIRFEAAKGIAGYVLKTGNILNIPAAYRDPRFNPEIDKQTGYRTQSILCVPLRNLSGKIIGVFEVINKKKGIFDKEDEMILSILSSQAAIAIENTQLYQELKQTKEKLFKENLRLKEKLRNQYGFQEIVGMSEKMTQVISLARKVADSQANILLLGESGTGKEIMARAIHYSSERGQYPFIALNCAALPESLLESELFGIEKGVATGVERRAGKFELANRGTIFLDEIGDMNLNLQAKLLRVIQERELQRVGSNKTFKLDLRVIAASNKDLEQEIREKKFREDLYYRLNVLSLKLPPLRERGEDIILLATRFLESRAKKTGREARCFSPRAREYLEKYPWPGNVRELQNEIERIIILINPAVREVSSEFISPKIKNAASEPREEKGEVRLIDTVERIKKEQIIKTLEKYKQNKTQAAKELGLSRQSLQKMMKRLGI